MDLASFKVSISNLSDEELMALLADIRTSRRPVTDLQNIKERTKTKARSSGSSKTSVAAVKNALTQDQLKLLIAKLQEAS